MRRSLSAPDATLTIDQRKEESLKDGRTGLDAAWLFVNSAGEPMDESRVRKVFAKCLKQAGLPLRFTPHSLRHSYSTLMLASGAPLTWVSQQLGHSSPQVTLDWYSWALPSGNKTHADLLDVEEGGGR